jgi:hypothetical protein
VVEPPVELPDPVAAAALVAPLVVLAAAVVVACAVLVVPELAVEAAAVVCAPELEAAVMPVVAPIEPPVPVVVAGLLAQAESVREIGSNEPNNLGRERRMWDFLRDADYMKFAVSPV